MVFFVRTHTDGVSFNNGIHKLNRDVGVLVQFAVFGVGRVCNVNKVIIRISNFSRRYIMWAACINQPAVRYFEIENGVVPLVHGTRQGKFAGMASRGVFSTDNRTVHLVDARNELSNPFSGSVVP